MGNFSGVTKAFAVVMSMGLIFGSERDETVPFPAQQQREPDFVQMSGCLVKKGDAYLLTDRTTGVTIEIRGPVASAAGHHVEIKVAAVLHGEHTAPGASIVASVLKIDAVGAACRVPVPGAGAAAAPGRGGALRIVVIAAAAAGVIGGLVAAGTFSGGKRH